MLNNIDEQLLKILNKPINENDMDVQEKYFRQLQNLIHAVILIRQKKISKSLFKIDDLDHYLKQSIDLICQRKDEKILNVVTQTIILKINAVLGSVNNITPDSIYPDIKNIYLYYSYSSQFPKDMVTKLYNKILNLLNDNFYQNEKHTIENDLSLTLPITPKKEQLIKKSLKEKILKEAISKRRFEEINCDEQTLKNKAMNKREEIKQLKVVKKSNIDITVDDFIYFETRFMQGALKLEEIKNLLGTTRTVAQKIYKKYEEIFAEYLKNITINDRELNLAIYRRRTKLGFDYNNFIIARNVSIEENAEELIKRMPSDLKKQILSNPKEYEEILPLIPFLDLFKEFGYDEYLKVLKHYKTIKNKLLENKTTQDKKYITDNEWLLKNLDKLIESSLGYASENEIEYAILGPKVYNKNPLRAALYAEVYLKMWQKKSSYVPIIKGTYKDYTYQTGDYQNPEHLLIGLNCHGSCIDLFNDKGVETYKKVLLDKDADVIWITKNNDFYARIFVFRKGNFLLMAPIRHQIEDEENKIDDELVRHIALTMLKEAILNEDNLGFVLQAESYFENQKNYPRLKDSRFLSKFPHADLNDVVYVLAQDPHKKQVSFDEPIKEEYFKQRQKISSEITKEELMRFKAIEMINNNQKEDFLPNINLDNYKKIYKGEDWVLLIDHNDQITQIKASEDKNCLNELAAMKVRLEEQKFENNNKPML